MHHGGEVHVGCIIEVRCECIMEAGEACRLHHGGEAHVGSIIEVMCLRDASWRRGTYRFHHRGQVSVGCIMEERHI